MIGFLEGSIHNFESDGILLLCGNIGYEIVLTPQMVESLRSSQTNEVALYIYYHLTERQPKPVLIGFETIGDKAFFQTFITVAAIGPMKAVKAMSRSVGEIANAIEKKDVKFLTGLNGIGKRTAEKIIATLHGKMESFIALTDHTNIMDKEKFPVEMNTINQQVADVLIEQLGHSSASAKRMIKEAYERNTAILTPEDLFDEIFKEKR